MKFHKILFLILFFSILGFLHSPSAPQMTNGILEDDLFEDFETKVIPTWSATGLWHIENNSQSNYTLDYLPSGSRYAWYGDNRTGNYDTGSRNAGNLTSGILNLTPFIDTQIYLSFWSWGDTESNLNYDRKDLYISPDAGITWTLLSTLQATPTWEHFSVNLTNWNWHNGVMIRFAFDSVDGSVNSYRGWSIDDVAIRPGKAPLSGYFDLNIVQESSAIVNETKGITFTAIPHFNQDILANVSVVVETPSSSFNTIYSKDLIIFTDLSLWTLFQNYTFTEAGHYGVYFNLIDEFGRNWHQNSEWVIIEGYYDLWIDLTYYPGIYDTEEILFSAQSSFGRSTLANITITMDTPSTTLTLLSLNETTILPNGKWQFNVTHNFTEFGMYYVWFTLDVDTNQSWTVWDYFYVYEHWDLWIEQDWISRPGDARDMRFVLDSKWNSSKTVSIEILVETPSGFNDSLLLDPAVFIPRNGWWDRILTYSFFDKGKYTVYFKVDDGLSAVWTTCEWEIGDLSVWIEQQNYAAIGSENSMDFFVQNWFNTPMFLSMEAWIEPYGQPAELLFSEYNILLDPFNAWERMHYYTFIYPGDYKVIFNVWSSGLEWSADNWWYVSTDGGMGDPILNLDNPEEVNVNQTFEVVVQYYTGLRSETFISYVNITYADNEAPIAGGEYLVEKVFPAETWANFTLRLTLPHTGEFTLRAMVHTDQGIIEHKFFIKVHDESNTNSQVNISPGFEAFLLFVPLLMVTVTHRKRNR
ncbi:MAG: hypothetical protein ACFFE8_16340 [Candidatus Heimdallarchaeota archaeon]